MIINGILMIYFVATVMSFVVIAGATACGPDLLSDSQRRIFFATDGGDFEGNGINMLTGENPYPGKLEYAGPSHDRSALSSLCDEARLISAQASHTRSTSLHAP